MKGQSIEKSLLNTLRNSPELCLQLRDNVGAVSLRRLETFVIRTCREENVTYKLGDCLFSVYENYRFHIRQYSKAYFDPFCRNAKSQRLVVDMHGLFLETNVGQLNFLVWATKHGVFDYMRMKENKVGSRAFSSPVSIVL